VVAAGAQARTVFAAFESFPLLPRPAGAAMSPQGPCRLQQPDLAPLAGD